MFAFLAGKAFCPDPVVHGFMALSRIQVSLLVTVGGILLAGMLLVNLIFLVFWHHDGLRREINMDRLALARVRDLLPPMPANPKNPIRLPLSFTDLYPGREKGALYLYVPGSPENKYVPGPPESNLLGQAMRQAIRTGRPVVRSTGFLASMFSQNGELLVRAEPVIRNGQVVASAGVIRSHISSRIIQVEKTVIIYILINLLALGAIGFFRIRRLIGRPIGRLVRLAEQYRDENTVFLAPESGGDEFARLAVSLNSMLKKIEEDKKNLEKSLAELGAANEKLRNQQGEMVQAEKMASLGRMAAGLAHEIGNPLGVVQGYLGLVAASPALAKDEEVADFIRRAEQEINRIAGLVRQLLDYGRMSGAAPARLSLHAAIESVVDMLGSQQIFADIQMVTECKACPDTIFADQEHLRQVLVNCLLNSRDGIAQSGRSKQGKIVVSTENMECNGRDYLRVSIVDNGSGVDQEFMEKIFDPFVTSKEPGKGTGLGLSISRSLVEGMGGTMSLENNDGPGVTVQIILPRYQNENVSES